uniref:Uncharacterized protein n=1 Tax=Physcomitrium patens TaxID=3218 RepID=A0A2K1L7S5_PHYPA|nr:hypothetical protein PHYPA_000510 [Physcomitrium patens]
MIIFYNITQVQEESTWNLPASTHTLTENVDLSDQEDVFEATISALDIQVDDSGWYLELGATKHVSGILSIV